MASLFGIRLGLLVIAAVAGLTVSNAGAEQIPIEGQLTDEEGRPLADVLVCRSSVECALTNNEGRFAAEVWEHHRAIHFAQDDFVPLTMTIQNPGQSLATVLRHGEDSTWKVPSCSEGLKDGNRQRPLGFELVGFGYRIWVPNEAEIIEGSDIDYQTRSIGFRWRNQSYWLKIGSGSSWSSGLPFAVDLNTSVEVVERNLMLGRSIRLEDEERILPALDGPGRKSVSTL